MRISVVIPVKDDASQLEECLRALREQTRPADEIVVVDNDSDDRSAEVARRWGARCVGEERPGIPAAASTGYDAATGDAISRLDADSTPPTGWLAHVEEVFGHPEPPDAATGSGLFPSLSGVARWAAQTLYMGTYFAVFTPVLGHPPVFGSAFAMTAGAWRAARGAVHRDDPEVHDDLDLAFQLDTVRREPLLDVPISARPFGDVVAFGRRIRRGAHTVLVNRGPRAMKEARSAWRHRPRVGGVDPPPPGP